MIRKLIGGAAERYFRSFDPAFLTAHHPYYHSVARDPLYDRLYAEGLVLTKTPPSLWRRDRFYNFYSSLDLVAGLDGDIAECGVWKGLSSYIACHKLLQHRPGFSGEGYHLIDSFEGLSVPTVADRLPSSRKGQFAGSIDDVRAVLCEFPGLAFHKGWIPNVFATLSDRQYRFVHIDVDLQEPTVAAFDYFYPRLVKGGVILCDDYASRSWPGTKKAVDSICAELGATKRMALSSCELLVIRE